MKLASSTNNLRERKSTAIKMNWNSSGQEESDNEMFQMSSSRMQEDGARVRLLSLSEDEVEPPRNERQEVPTLTFRRNLPLFSRKDEEKKFKLALISVLVIGITLIIIINIGLGIGLSNVSDRSPTVVNPCINDQKKANENEQHCEESFPWQSYRLPDHIHPQHYIIFLHPNLTLRTYTGKVDILIHASQPTDKIILHSIDQDVKNIKVFLGDTTKDSATAKEIQQKSPFSKCSNYEFLAIVLKEDLFANGTYTIHIEFSGNFPATSLRGFYLSNYKTAAGKNRTIATTQFEPISARSAFPCFDEPLFKANFTLSMVHEPHHSALFNMPIEKTTVIEGGLQQDEFQTSVVMSTYLVAFIVSDFVSISKNITLKNGKIPVSVYASKDKISKAGFALDVACKILTLYEQVFQIPYPLPKLDLVAIPDFEAGAMENWGLVTYRETAILYDEKTSSTRDKQWVAIVIAHELAHQWFGNLVTMKWWNDLWLNEGFASYVEFYGTNKIFPEWHIMSSYNLDTSSAMATDESTYTHPISVKVDSSVEIDELFDTISYQKGSRIISMLIDYLSEKLFFNGVADYLKMYAYQNTVNENLINAVANRAESAEKQGNIKKMMKSWTTQSGFPVVTISKNGNKVTVFQSRYLLSVPDQAADVCTKDKQLDLWEIPLSYITDESPNHPQWYYLDKRQASFTLTGNPKWIKFNFNRGGYYVINYSSDMMDTLIKQMKTDHNVFRAKDRAGILEDAMKAAKTGRLSYEKVFDLLSYLKNEEEYEPIYTVGLFLKGIEDTLKRQFDNPTHENIKLLAKKLLGHIYSKYGWEADPKALSHSQKLMRKLVVSAMCLYEDKDCLDKALSQFDTWKKGNYTIPLDFKSTVYCTGIRMGTSGNWDHVWDAYANDLTLDAAEKLKLLVGLTCTHDVNKMDFLLDEALKGQNIKTQDISRVFSYLTYERAGSYIAWKFIRSKLNEITKISPLGSFMMRSIFQSIVSTFTDKSDIAGAEQFFAANNLTDVRYIKRALDKAKIKLHWIENYQPDIVRWLKDNVNSV